MSLRFSKPSCSSIQPSPAFLTPDGQAVKKDVPATPHPKRRKALEAIVECSTTEEDDSQAEELSSEEDALLECDFLAMVKQFAIDNGIEVTKALFNREMKALRPQKKQKIQ